MTTDETLIQLAQYIERVFDGIKTPEEIFELTEMVMEFHSCNAMTDEQYFESFQAGDLVEDCRFHIGMVVKTYEEDWSIDTRSIFDASSRCCAIFGCGPRKLKSEEVDKVLKVLQNDGMNAAIDLLADQYETRSTK